MMYDLFIYGLKVVACTGVFYIFYKLLLSKETYHRINRMVLLIGFVASYLLPLFVITFTKVIQQEPVVIDVTENAITDTAVTNEPLINEILIENILGLIFIAGVAAMLLRLGKSIRQIMKFVRSGNRKTLDNGTILVTSDERTGAFSWLKYIVISRYENEEESKLIMLHEQGHIRMHHTYDLLLVDILGALQWFNPFMWMLRSELKNIHEFEADQYVLNKGVDAKKYQLLLIKKAVGASRYSVANSFNHNKLKIRITMMLNKKSSKIARAKALLVLPLLCVGVMAFAETDYVYAVDKGSENSVETVSNDSLKVLYLVDGKQMESINGLNADDIAGMTVLKKGQISQYGNYDKVIEITTKGNVKEVTVNGTVKDNDGQIVPGAVVEISGTNRNTVTDRKGNFLLKAKNTDIISVSYSGYNTANMKASDKMSITLQPASEDAELNVTTADLVTVANTVNNKIADEIENELNDTPHPDVNISVKTTVGGPSTKGKVISVSRSQSVSNGKKNVSTSVDYNDKDKTIVIKDSNNNPLLIKTNGTDLENTTVYVDGRKVESLNDFHLQSDKIFSIDVEPDNKIFITLKKDGMKYPTQKEIVKAQKHINGKGKKYYVTTKDGTMDVIRAKNEKEAIRYCQTHYDKNVMLTKRPNGGLIKVVKPVK